MHPCMTAQRPSRKPRLRATRNICTNEALYALAASVYLATMSRQGIRTVTIKSDGRGRVDMAHLRTLLTEKQDNIAALILTNPNTLGLFEGNIAEICAMIYTAGDLVYCMHFSLHKMFSSPHEGGGPGSGPVGMKSILEPYLPVPQLVKTEDGYRREYDRPKSIGRIHGYYGSFLCILRAYAYIPFYGRERLANIAENAVLNAKHPRPATELLRCCL